MRNVKVLETKLREAVANLTAETLVKNGLNQSKTALELGISRGTLRKYIQQYTPGPGKGLGKRTIHKFFNELK